MKKETIGYGRARKFSDLTPLERYPEFEELVADVVRRAVDEINHKVKTIESAMPYKSQFVLEEVVKQLKEAI